MEFHFRPPGTEDKPEGLPSQAKLASARPIPASAHPGRGGAAPAATAVRASLRTSLVAVTMHWFGWLIPLALVTQLWAGSQFSPGQGGGLKELVGWVFLFGIAVPAMVAERHAHTDSGDPADDAIPGAYVGFVIGAIVAVIWFTAKGGPGPGDWFVGPGSAATGAGVMLYIVAPVRGS